MSKTVDNLRKCIKVVRSIPDPQEKMLDGNPKFDMKHYRHQCGSPSCVLGWFLSVHPDYERAPLGLLGFTHIPSGAIVYPSDIIDTEFPDLSDEQAEELFEANGCGNARTPESAALYIEEFIAREFKDG